MKKEIKLSLIDIAAIRHALRTVIDMEGGPLALAWMKGPYKKLHRQLIRADVNLGKQLRRKK